MAYNLFVAYDLISPGQNYDAVRDRIKSLGAWYQFQFSLFYLQTSLTPQQTYAAIWQVMDPNDRLAVINAAGATLNGAHKPVFDAINSIWFGAQIEAA